jgi:NAD dependent epimerase/dehydratase
MCTMSSGLTPSKSSNAAFWAGRRVLVTGAGGFIGSHLTERLSREGANVRAFVRYNSRNEYGWLDSLEPGLVERVEVFRGDLANPEALANALDDQEIVLHLGALIPIPYSYQHPREFVAANVIGTLNLLEAARRREIDRIVHVSTSEVYGTAISVPIDEGHPLRAQSPYAATKIAADQLALSYKDSFGLGVVVARPFNTFGPRQSARAVIPTIISQALSREQIELGATHPMRDFLYVQDTVSGLMSCGRTEGIEGEVINLGSGREISIGEAAEFICRLLGREVPIIQSDARLRPPASEVERLLADNDKASRLLDWRPEITLEDGLRQTVEWMTGTIEEYRPSIYNV